MLSQRDSPLLHTLNREWYHRSSLSARTAFWDLMAEVAGHFETILAQCEGGRLFGVVPRESPLRLKAEVHGAQTAWPSRFHVAQKWRGYEKAEPHSHECEKVSRYDNTGKGHRHKVQFSGDGKVSGGLALLVCPCLVIHGYFFQEFDESCQDLMRLLFSHFSADELQELWNHYDNGCNGYEVAFNREPALASKMNLYSNQFHHVTHKCSQAWRWPLGSNASSNESVNSWFAQFRSPAIGMNATSFMLFINVMVVIWNLKCIFPEGLPLRDAN